MEPEVRKQPIRFYEIDLLRFLAAIAVVFYHYTYRGYASGQYSPIPFLGLGVFTRYGYLGVELFFIISGYVVLLSAQYKTIRQFFISRITRLYPAFWVACTITFIAEYAWQLYNTDAKVSPFLYASIGQYGWNMTMLNGFINVLPIDGVYWSLSVEIRFYILIALLLISKQMQRVDWFLLLWVIYAAYIGPAAVDFSTRLLMPRYAGYFAAGMLFYLIQNQVGRTWFRYLLLMGCYVLAIRSALERTHEQSLLGHTEISRIIVVIIVSLFFVIFFLITFKKINFSKMAWLTWLGVLTYPLYLLHQHVGFIIFNILYGYLNKYLILGCTVLAMIVCSYLIHIHVEKRIGSLLLININKWFPTIKK